jgi:hypothetical protein
MNLMKNKKLIFLAAVVMMCSQFSIGITVFASTETATEIENISNEQIDDMDIEIETEVNNSLMGTKLKDSEIIAETVVDEESKVFGPETRGTSMTIDEPNPLWVSLGSTEKDFSNAIYDQGNIKIDGNKINWGDVYFSTMIISGNTNVISDTSSGPFGKYFSTVHDINNNTGNYTSVSSNYKVNYGNSIVFGSRYNMLGAFTHHAQRNERSSTEYVITASNGVNDNNNIINGNFIGKDYYKIEYFPKFGDWSNPSKSVVAQGDDKRADVLRKWGTTKVVNGGVIRTWCANKNDNNLFVSNQSNTQEKNHANKEGYAYYKITETGFEPFQVTPLKIVPRTITTRTTDNQLDDMLNDLFEDIPNGVSVDKFIEYPKRDKVGKSKGKVQVTENSSITQNKNVVQVYEIPFDVIEVPLEVKFKENLIPVGTPNSKITPNDYIEKVVVGDEVLNQSEYTATFETPINTMKTGVGTTKIKVVTNNGTVTEEIKTEVVWGSSLVSLGSNKKDMDTSVSLLDNNGKPYLVANEGTGLSAANRLDSRTTMNIYRGNDIKENYSATNITVNQKPADLMNRWNNEFQTYDLAYGDVLTYTVFNYGNAKTNENGKNTWVSRDGELVKETEGHDVAYYELTPKGFNLLKLNQLKVNPKLIQVNVGAEEEEMDQKASETLIGSNTSNYEFKFAEFDTSKSGKQSGKVNVYETLATGGKFMTTYEVEYIVNPQVTEKYVTEKGETLKSPVLTNFDFGTEYQVSPENFITIDGDLYIYQGWLEENQTAGKDTPKKETPKAVKEATTFQYVYKKADNMIDMTIPTEMIFSTERESKNIVSKKQAFKNNSKDVSTEIIMTDFVSKKSDVKLLTEKDADPKKEANEARFNLMKEEQIAIDSLNEKTKEQSITTLKSGETTDISLAGKYFGSQDKKKHVDYQMNFKFKAHIK